MNSKQRKVFLKVASTRCQKVFRKLSLKLLSRIQRQFPHNLPISKQTSVKRAAHASVQRACHVFGTSRTMEEDETRTDHAHGISLSATTSAREPHRRIRHLDRERGGTRDGVPRCGRERRRRFPSFELGMDDVICETRTRLCKAHTSTHGKLYGLRRS